MKKIILLTVISVLVVACRDNVKTVYDYLSDEVLLHKVFKQCTSGSLDDELTCNNVKRAYGLLDAYKDGVLTEQDLRELGKK